MGGVINELSRPTKQWVTPSNPTTSRTAWAKINKLTDSADQASPDAPPEIKVLTAESPA